VLADLFQNQFRHLRNQNASSAWQQHKHSEDKRVVRVDLIYQQKMLGAESDQRNAHAVSRYRAGVYINVFRYTCHLATAHTPLL